MAQARGCVSIIWRSSCGRWASKVLGSAGKTQFQTKIASLSKEARQSASADKSNKPPGKTKIASVRMGKYKEASKRTKVGIISRYEDKSVRVEERFCFCKQRNQRPWSVQQQRLRKGYNIGKYMGRILTVADAEQRKWNKFCMSDIKVGGRIAYVIDGANAKTSSVLRYVNAADTKD
jgi:hypothetical protein